MNSPVKHLLCSSSVVIASLIATGSTLLAQGAPATHAEVWQNVETRWTSWAARDLEGFMGFHHPAYSGWDAAAPMHRGANATREWIRHELATIKILAHDVDAVDIKIHGEMAIVHYYFSVPAQQPGGAVHHVTGRRTDVLGRQGDRWLLLADHSSATTARSADRP